MRLFSLFIVAALLACGPLASGDALPDRSGGGGPRKDTIYFHAGYAAPRQVLVKFRPGTGRERLGAILAEMHLEVVRPVQAPDLYLLQISDTASVASVLKRLQSYEEVEYAEPNYVRQAD